MDEMLSDMMSRLHQEMTDIMREGVGEDDEGVAKTEPMIGGTEDEMEQADKIMEGAQTGENINAVDNVPGKIEENEKYSEEDSQENNTPNKIFYIGSDNTDDTISDTESGTVSHILSSSKIDRDDKDNHVPFYNDIVNIDDNDDDSEMSSDGTCDEIHQILCNKSVKKSRFSKNEKLQSSHVKVWVSNNGAKKKGTLVPGKLRPIVCNASTKLGVSGSNNHILPSQSTTQGDGKELYLSAKSNLTIFSSNVTMKMQKVPTLDTIEEHCTTLEPVVEKHNERIESSMNNDCVSYDKSEGTQTVAETRLQMDTLESSAFESEQKLNNDVSCLSLSMEYPKKVSNQGYQDMAQDISRFNRIYQRSCAEVTIRDSDTIEQQKLVEIQQCKSEVSDFIKVTSETNGDQQLHCELDSSRQRKSKQDSTVSQCIINDIDQAKNQCKDSECLTSSQLFCNISIASRSNLKNNEIGELFPLGSSTSLEFSASDDQGYPMQVPDSPDTNIRKPLNQSPPDSSSSNPPQLLVHRPEDEWTEERSTAITEALDWIRNQLQEMREEDQDLACRFMDLHFSIREIKLQRCCDENREALDDAMNLDTDLRDSLIDFVPGPLSPALKDMGLTRMNFSSRRFSVL